jgi:hypothetical protein
VVSLNICLEGLKETTNRIASIPAKQWSVKEKGKLSLCLIKHYTMKAYRGVDVWIQVFLTSALVGGEWSASRLCRFNPK